MKIDYYYITYPSNEIVKRITDTDYGWYISHDDQSVTIRKCWQDWYVNPDDQSVTIKSEQVTYTRDFKVVKKQLIEQLNSKLHEIQKDLKHLLVSPDYNAYIKAKNG